MSDSKSAGATPSPEEIESIRKRNAELEQQLANTSRTSGWRMYTALVLVVLFGLVLVPASQAAWLATTTLNTDRFVSTFAPLPEDPAVATALGTRVAARVAEEVALGELIAEPLPPDLRFIASPIAGAVETVIAEVATRIISSQPFGTLWEDTLRVTHSAAISVVEGSRSGVVQAEQGQVILDLSTLVERVDDQLRERGIDVLDPEEIDAIIVLYEADELALVETITKLIYAVRWVSPIVTLILLIGAVLVASDRRKVTIWLGIATILAMAFTLIGIRFLRNSVIESISDPVLADGASAAWNIVFDRLLAQTWALLALGLVAGLVAWFFGPSERASRLRESFVTARAASRGDVELTPTTKFIRQYRRVIEWVTIGLGAIFLLTVPTVRGWIVIVVAVVVIAVVAAVEWIAGTGSIADRAEPEEAGTQAPEDSVDA